MLEDVQLCFTSGEQYVNDTAYSVEKGHGRIERRCARTSDALHGYSAFPGLHQVIEVRRHVTVVRTGEERREVEYGITDIAPWDAGAQTLMQLLRGHWGIENKNNHVRDDSWREDRMVLRKGRGAYSMSILTDLALMLLRTASPYWRATDPLTARAETLRDITLTPSFTLRKVS